MPRPTIAACSARWRGLAIAITFYEPDAFERQQHRDIEPPDWARVVVYPATPGALRGVIAEAARADVVVKASGVGVFDDELLAGTIAAAAPGALRVFWDVDAPATLAALRADPAHPLHAALDAARHGADLWRRTAGGRRLSRLRRACVRAGLQRARSRRRTIRRRPIRRSPPTCRCWRTGCRIARRGSGVLPRPRRRAAASAASCSAESGWGDKAVPANVRAIGHVPTAAHNSFNASALAVLNVARDSMAEVGFSPATRVFEAAGAGACLITDAWEGIELFLEPDEEILVARDGADVAAHLAALTPERARQIGARALRRVLRDHTYAQRAEDVHRLLTDALARKREAVAA